MRAAVTISVAGVAARHGSSGGAQGGRAAFTLVELLVSMVILAILAALSLAGLAGVRQRAKADKTRNTIRKIDAVIRPMYDSYRTRRVTVTGLSSTDPNLRSKQALQGLLAKRTLLAYEMPDSWADVPTSLSTVPAGPPSSSFSCRTAPVRASVRIVQPPSMPSPAFGSAECLYMIVARSGFDPDSLEFFRTDEFADVDGDSFPEFVDGWGRPIAFLRWAPGFVSPLQDGMPASSTNHDPLDPIGVDLTAPALVPLIYSAGPDGATATPSDDTTGYGLRTLSGGWLASSRKLSQLGDSANQELGQWVGSPITGDTSSLDNITNHDLLKK
jgi:prepilin-type N-terminal cleavage/methylation domain-containing protein